VLTEGFVYCKKSKFVCMDTPNCGLLVLLKELDFIIFKLKKDHEATDFGIWYTDIKCSNY